MLTHLSIHQFALIKHLELEFGPGMTVITGETGAGKSILLDALGLAIGQRADASHIRAGAERAEVSACFSLNSKAQKWLEEHMMDAEEQVTLRRVISIEGRSRAYINGRSVSILEVKDLSRHLIEVHSQNAHQRLLEKDTARQLLDAFGELQADAKTVSRQYKCWNQAAQQLKSLQEQTSEAQAQQQLLSYQVDELRELDLGERELEQLEEEHKRLTNADSTRFAGQSALIACQGDDSHEQSATQLAYQSLQQLRQLDDQHPSLLESKELLQQAHIQLAEAASSLQSYLEQIDVNPQRLQQVESRLSDIFSLARKHHIQPPHLHSYWQQQEQALAELSLSDEDMVEREQAVQAMRMEYLQAAEQLSVKRRQAAQRMDAQIESHFESLALGRARFFTQIEALPAEQATQHGLEAIQFAVQTNPGMPAGSLAKVASGGELSRISLAIQVVTAATSQVPSVIFDEVDVGIGGGTAERVGRLMRQLGESSQVMCVTHQPQVAAQAHQHFQVSKISGSKATHTQIRELNDHQRSEEVARMLGGIEITQQTLAHAQEMLEQVQNVC